MKSIEDSPEGSSGSYSATGPIHSPDGWRDTVRLYVANDAPEIVIEATLEVVNSWNLAAGHDILSYEGTHSPENVGSLFSVLEDSITMIYFETEWSKNTGKSEQVLGTTVWENEGNHNRSIARGDIILNGSNFYYQDATEEPEDLDRVYDIADAESVLLHEMGHLLGLDHVGVDEDPNSVMHSSTPIGLDITKRELSAGDIALIQQIYSGDSN